MSIIHNNNNIIDNQEEEDNYYRYMSRNEEQEKLENELAAYDRELDLLREQEITDHLAAAANELSAIREEEEEEEEETQQVAQITVNGIFRYELFWLPDSNELRVEIDQDRKGKPIYYWYPDTMSVITSLANLMGCDEDKIKIEGLAIFGEGRAGVEAEALPYEVETFMKSTWNDYASEKYAVQFNVNLPEKEEEEEEKTAMGTCGHAESDLACSAQTCGRQMTEAAFNRRLEEVWRNNHPTRHGLDGTQCDCFECERANEMPAGMEPWHESVEEDRLPTVYECLNLPKRISDALIRNWVARQPDEDKACAEAAELSMTARRIASQM